MPVVRIFADFRPTGIFEGRGWPKGPYRGFGSRKKISLKLAENPQKYGRWAFLKGGGAQKVQKGVSGPEKKFGSNWQKIRENTAGGHF